VRLFEDTKAVVTAAGAISRRARVLDSTAVNEAVATQDIVTHLGEFRHLLSMVSAIRGDIPPAYATRGLA
jgi:hypothetical protein